jgi:hypothetical protein
MGPRLCQRTGESQSFRAAVLFLRDENKERPDGVSR